MEIESSPEPDPLPQLSNLTSFVTNAPSAILCVERLPDPEFAALCRLLSSGAEIDHLALPEGLVSYSELQELLKRTKTIRSISVNAASITSGQHRKELIRVVTAAGGANLEQIEVMNITLGPEESRIFGRTIQECESLNCLSIIHCTVCWPEIIPGIRKAKLLSSVSLSTSEIGSDAGMQLCDSLSRLPDLRNLELNVNPLNPECFAKLSCVLGWLRVLNLGYGRLGDLGIAALVDGFLSGTGLNKKCTLQKLLLRSNGIGPAGGEKLAKLLTRAGELQELELTNNKIGEGAAGEIGEALACLKTITRIDIYACQLGSRGVVAMFSPMKGGCALDTLSVGSNMACDAGVKAMTEALRGVEQLAFNSIKMQTNNITHVGAKTLAPVLAKASSIQSLELSYNNLGPSGGFAIFDALATRGKPPMDLLGLERCGLGDSGVEAAGRFIILRGCRLLRLSNNSIRDGGVKIIVDALGQAAPLRVRELRLNENPLRSSVKYIADKLVREDRSVEELSIVIVEMGLAGAKVLASAIDGMNKEGPLRVLDLHGRDCTADGIKMLYAVAGGKRRSGQFTVNIS